MVKKTLKTLTLLLLLVITGSLPLPIYVEATSYDSTNFSVKDSVIDGGQKSSSSTNFQAGQSVGQPAIGKSTSSNFKLWSGFQYFYKVSSNTLTATAGDSQVSLSWTVPDTFLGISVSSYEVGTGTVSGTYTYESVGAVTSFTKSGLTNNTPYFFIVKAKGIGGIVLAYSNEATATPTATVVPGGGSGGGSTQTPESNLIFSGLAAPNSKVSLIQDFSLVGNVDSDEFGRFSMSVPGGSSNTSNFVLFYTDPTGLKSNPQTFIVQAGQTANYQNILLPPTITGSHSSIKKGSFIYISGYSAPLASISLSFMPNSPSLETQTNATGYYTFKVATDNLSLGIQEVKTFIAYQGFLSQASFSFKFLVGAKSVVYEKPAVCGDFNQDNRVNIVDFSILIYWYGKLTPPGRVDCNQDNKIDIFDVSILMYNWTG
jgi:hypothetical protein